MDEHFFTIHNINEICTFLYFILTPNLFSVLEMRLGSTKHAAQ